MTFEMGHVVQHAADMARCLAAMAERHKHASLHLTLLSLSATSSVAINLATMLTLAALAKAGRNKRPHPRHEQRVLPAHGRCWCCSCLGYYHFLRKLVLPNSALFQATPRQTSPTDRALPPRPHA